jgi:hypothetical protein
MALGFSTTSADAWNDLMTLATVWLGDDLSQCSLRRQARLRPRERAWTSRAASGANGNYGVWNRYLRQRQHRHDDARAKSQNFWFKGGRTRSTYVANTLLGLQRNGQAFINIIGSATSLLGLDSVIPERRPKAASDATTIPTGLRSVREAYQTKWSSFRVSTTSPWRALSVTGTVGFDGLAGSTGAGSLCLDGSKQVVYNSCLSSTRARLEPVSFIYKNGECRTRYGFIAEDAAAVDAHLATTTQAAR